MPGPVNQPPRQNLEAILDQARRNMQQKMAASAAAANGAFAQVATVNPHGRLHGFTNGKDGAVPAISAPSMTQAAQDIPSANPHFTHARFAPDDNYGTQDVAGAINQNSNTSQNSSYQLRPGTFVPQLQLMYRNDTPTKNKPRAHSQPARPTSPTTPTRLASPFEPQSRRTAGRDQKRYLEAMEPDLEDDNMLLWESWALRRLIKEKLGIDDQDIRNYLGQEYEHALDRKELREKLDRTNLRNDWNAYIADREVAHNANVTRVGPPRLQF